MLSDMYRDVNVKHWIDVLAEKLEESLKKRDKDVYIFNGGLSVSGLQHIGRLRGEVLLGEAVRRILEKKGYKIKQYITIYTQDPWKGKDAQVRTFRDPKEGRKYTGWPLIRVPDPYGCHKSWVDHYWEDFGTYLDKFTDGKIEVITTTDMYKTILKPIVKEIISKRETARKIINKYRSRKPYPENWIPFEPICEKCGRIDTTEALRIIDEEHIEYQCNNCGYKGVSSIENGKLNWRLEWASIWKALGVDFEPFGKDHATPGGSRDSCVDLSVNLLNYTPPEGQPYEWVALRVPGGGETDMSSSEFTGITPREWLEIAHAEILRFIYFQTPPLKKIVIDLTSIPQYYERFYTAEKIYYGVEKQEDEEVKALARTYELSLLEEPPERIPVQIPYAHMALLSQILPSENKLEKALKRLRESKVLTREELMEADVKRIKELLDKAGVWAQRYAPSHYRIKLLEELSEDIKSKITMRSYLHELAARLEALEEWSEDRIKEELIEFGKDFATSTRKEFYRNLYLLLLGKEFGPRAAPLLAMLGKEFVIKRLREA